MTYNFDADRWYENELRLLEHRLKTGDIDEEEHRQQVNDLDRRYEEMLRRLDGTYTIPETKR
jgi:hypothetical protein